jgi:hypothetical protein
MRARHTALRLFAIPLTALAIFGGPVLGQDDEATRAVRIIEGAPGQAATPSAPGTLVAPTSPPPVATIDIHQTSIRAENEAGLELSILPDVELVAGTKVALRVATKKQGYLILVDVDPAGKLTQIYPNRHMLERRDNQESLNLIKAGQAVTIPNRDNPYAGFEFVASPPAGVAMLVAILSDRPVHLLDLPDVAPPGSGQVSFDQLSETARRLRIAREDGSIAPEGPRWSFDAKLYLVK